MIPLYGQFVLMDVAVERPTVVSVRLTAGRVEGETVRRTFVNKRVIRKRARCETREQGLSERFILSDAEADVTGSAAPQGGFRSY